MTRPGRASALITVLLAALGSAGCFGGAAADAPADDAFATSGSPEADQRAEQQMAKAQQVGGTGDEADADETGPDPEAEKSLFDRLGGQRGVAAVADDVVDRALADPRVNLHRRGIEGGWIESAPEAWEPSPAEVQRVKDLLVEFVATASGGPVGYSGPPLQEAFAGRAFSNLEFDAAVGNLQAAMDKIGLPDQEQKELLAVVETTRDQVVEVR